MRNYYISEIMYLILERIHMFGFIAGEVSRS